MEPPETPEDIEQPIEAGSIDSKNSEPQLGDLEAQSEPKPEISSTQSTEQISIPKSDTRIENPEKAHAMANTEKAYQNVAIELDRLGLHDKAEEVRSEAQKAAEKTAMQYELDKPLIEKAEKEIMAKIIEALLHPNEQVSTIKIEPGRMQDEIVKLIYTILKVDLAKRPPEPTFYTSDQIRRGAVYDADRLESVTEDEKYIIKELYHYDKEILGRDRNQPAYVYITYKDSNYRPPITYEEYMEQLDEANQMRARQGRTPI